MIKICGDVSGDVVFWQRSSKESVVVGSDDRLESLNGTSGFRFTLTRDRKSCEVTCCQPQWFEYMTRLPTWKEEISIISGGLSSMYEYTLRARTQNVDCLINVNGLSSMHEYTLW